jgi:rod shape determining protein RodA
MVHILKQLAARVDWILVAAMLPLLAAGLVTMHSFTGESYFFTRQLMWIGISFAVFFVFALVDWRFLRRTWIVVTLYLISLASLVLVLLIGDVTLGAQSRFNLGPIAVQPADPAKLVTIIVLAKYFTRRHIEIANIKHILVSGFYAFTLFALVFLQPDFGSAIIIAAIWFGMVLVSGISKKHLAGVLLIGVISAIGLWFFGLEDYQKERIMTFLHPYTDVQGTGYNAYQSTIAVGSGQVLGKGLGYGTQSRLEFLPEYETDFIFAAFAEEWGFIGVLILFTLFGIVIWRILDNALYGASNFEVLFGVGVATLFMSHFVIHVGMNVGLLPVTGTTIPLLSYGGSHLVTEFAALGMLMGMRAYRRTLHRDHLPQELVGV